MTQYKIVVAYDGTDYEGWQVQPNQRAIANVLEKSFCDTFGKEIKLIGASRTDAGVHALGQVAVFKTDLNISSERMHSVWNDHLPQDILIKSLEPIPVSFHPQRNVREKIYWYHFFLQRPLPFLARYGYYFRNPIDLEKLKESLALFCGTHDFRSFCTGYEQESTIRTITSINVSCVEAFNVYRIEICGPGFLRYMIRRIVGACLEVASRPLLEVSILQKILDQKDPEHTLPNAPAKGLLLYSIMYKKDGNE